MRNEEYAVCQDAECTAFNQPQIGIRHWSITNEEAIENLWLKSQGLEREHGTWETKCIYCEKQI